MKDLQGLSVDLNQLGRVFDVDVDLSLAVRGGKLRFAFERNRSSNGAIRSRKGGGIFARSVKGENTFREGFIGDRVGILASRDRC